MIKQPEVLFIKRNEANEMNYGDLGKRTLAYIIDGVILGVINGIVSLLIGYILGYTVGIVAIPMLPWVIGPISLLIAILYYVLGEGGSNHGTLGKTMMGLYVADESGRGISYSVAILRLIGKIFSGMILGIGYFMAFFSETKQGLHDIIAKTYVLSGPVQVTPAERNANPGKYSSVSEIIGVKGPLAGRVYKIGPNGVAIGRDSVSCQIVVPSSQKYVSRVHCFVSYNTISGMYILSDRKSTHGTYLANGSKVTYNQPVALSSGDTFYIGTPDNVFKVS